MRDLADLSPPSDNNIQYINFISLLFVSAYF